jgi:tetraacyldisaccharide 4'-kinase
VASDRHLAGVLAESRLSRTVHLLDDGFQHVALARTVDLLMLRPDDFDDMPLPGGWLRESIDAAADADAWVVEAADSAAIEPHARRAHGPRMFAMIRDVGVPRLAEGSGPVLDPAAPVLLVSGIARPDRFEADIRAQGYAILDHVRLPDHYRFRRGDIARLAAEVARRGAAAVVTTEKDRVRLEALAPWPFAVAVAPLRVRIEPAADFVSWLMAHVEAARQGTGVKGQGR